MTVPRSIFNDPSPAQGMQFQASNSTGVLANSSKILLNCETCGLAFWRYAAWAKRKNHHYCGKPCADEAKRQPTEFLCSVCGVKFIDIPSNVGRIISCSKTCQAKRKSTQLREHPMPKHVHAKRGSGNGRLSADDANAIGVSAEATKILACRYGVSETTIRNIRRAARVVSATPPATSEE